MIVAATIAVALAGTASAQQQGGTAQPVSRANVVAQLDNTFKSVDTNHDGYLSKAEVKNAR